MIGLTQFLKSRASGRAVAGAVVFALLVALIQYAVLIPRFQAVATFKPFDVQFPLTRYMIAIQLGAYGEMAAPAYLPFLLVDLLLAFVSAGSLMLMWAWLFREQPNRAFAFFERGAVILVPVYTLISDIAEDIAFAWLIGGVSGERYSRTIELAVTAHSIRGAFLDLQVILTVLFVILFGMTAVKRQRSGAVREGAIADDR